MRTPQYLSPTYSDTLCSTLPPTFNATCPCETNIGGTLVVTLLTFTTLAVGMTFANQIRQACTQCTRCRPRFCPPLSENKDADRDADNHDEHHAVEHFLELSSEVDVDACGFAAAYTINAFFKLLGTGALPCVDGRPGCVRGSYTLPANAANTSSYVTMCEAGVSAASSSSSSSSSNSSNISSSSPFSSTASIIESYLSSAPASPLSTTSSNSSVSTCETGKDATNLLYIAMGTIFAAVILVQWSRNAAEKLHRCWNKRAGEEGGAGDSNNNDGDGGGGGTVQDDNLEDGKPPALPLALATLRSEVGATVHSGIDMTTRLIERLLAVLSGLALYDYISAALPVCWFQELTGPSKIPGALLFLLAVTTVALVVCTSIVLRLRYGLLFICCDLPAPVKTCIETQQRKLFAKCCKPRSQQKKEAKEKERARKRRRNRAYAKQYLLAFGLAVGLAYEEVFEEFTEHKDQGEETAGDIAAWAVGLSAAMVLLGFCFRCFREPAVIDTDRAEEEEGGGDGGGEGH